MLLNDEMTSRRHRRWRRRIADTCLWPIIIGSVCFASAPTLDERQPLRLRRRNVRLPDSNQSYLWRGCESTIKAAFHDTDTDILAYILARIAVRIHRRVGRLRRSACHGNDFRKSRVLDVSARILARMSVSVSWNAALTQRG